MAFWAFLLAAAYLPLPLGFLAWFSLARPFAIIARLRPKEAFKAAYFFCFLANLFHLYWVANVTPPGMIAAVFILSLYPAIILWIFNKIYRLKKIIGLIALPFLWVGMEYFRSLSEFAFPWTDLSYSQGYYLTLIQIASIVGCYGVSLIFVWLNILVWKLIDKSVGLKARYVAGMSFIALLLILFAYGWVTIPTYENEGKFRIAMLQGNVDLKTKWKPETRPRNFDLYDSLSMVASQSDPNLIIWPETAAPCYPRQESNYRQRLSATAYLSGANHLLGALDVEYDEDNENKRRSYNSAFQFDRLGNMNGVYHKIKLVPFSEHSPYQETMPFLTRQFLQEYVTIIKTQEVQWWSDFYTGDSIILFESDSVKYSTLICFEIAFPDFVRQGVLKGAQFLTTITNDTWFGRSPGPYQHMRIAVFRAIENRIWLARCANSGISAIVDPYGKERIRGDLYKREILQYNIKPTDELSFFTRTGPIVGQISLWIIVISLLFLIFRGAILRLAGKT